MGSAGDGGGRPALQRVVVHAALRSRGQVLVGVSGPREGVLPWVVLAHGETPVAGVARALAAAGAPPTRTCGPLTVLDAVRTAVPDAGTGAVDLHTVHVVMAAEVTDHERRDAVPADAGRWLAWDGVDLPLVPDDRVDVEPAELRRLVAPVGDAPVLRQRLAAYAVVVTDEPAGRERILLTRLSGATPSPGRWTLPGGGVDHGEHPLVAAVREVHEETGMDVDVDRLVDIGSEHFTGRSPRGVLEDFHAVRVLVTATARRVQEPEVLDVGGSTDLASWVRLDEAAGTGLVGVAHRGVQIALRRRNAG